MQIQIRSGLGPEVLPFLTNSPPDASGGGGGPKGRVCTAC